MKLELFTKGIERSAHLSQAIERRLRSALGRFRGRVSHVRVWLEDVNGPRGGEDLRCRMEARLVPAFHVRAEETRSGTMRAVHLATQRLENGVARRLDRVHARRKGRI